MKKWIYILLPIFSMAQINLCDSIFVDLIDFNDNNFQVGIDTEYTTQYWFGYCGLMMTNNQGDTIALENINTAANVYGLGPNMSEPRYLEVQQENLDFPVDGQIHLVENFFAGNGYIVCSWPFYFELANNSHIHEKRIDNHIVKTIDFLGRETNQNGLHINLYNDGVVKKLLK